MRELLIGGCPCEAIYKTFPLTPNVYNISSVTIVVAFEVTRCQQQVRLDHFSFRGTPRSQLVDLKSECLTFPFRTHIPLCKPLLLFRFEPTCAL